MGTHYEGMGCHQLTSEGTRRKDRYGTRNETNELKNGSKENAEKIKRKDGTHRPSGTFVGTQLRTWLWLQHKGEVKTD